MLSEGAAVPGVFLFLLRRREVKVPSGWMSPALGHFREVLVGMESAWEQHFVICPCIIPYPCESWGTAAEHCYV